MENETAYSNKWMKGIGERWIDIFLKDAVTIVFENLQLVQPL